MIKLSELLKAHYDLTIDFDCEIIGLAIDSRLVQPGFLFFAYAGTHHDGRNHINDAMARGACAVLIESDSECIRWQSDIPMIEVRSLRHKISEMAAQFYHYPARSLRIVGITGTNGKTSCSHFISAALTAAGIPCGIIGTLGSGLMGALKPTGLTTPDPISLQAIFAELVAVGAKAVAMVVSSHSLDQGRVRGIEFEVVVFTNLTQDHLDYHRTMTAYSDAKRKLFTDNRWRQAVINADDEFGRSLMMSLPAGQFTSFSLEAHAGKGSHVFAESVVLDITGVKATVVSPWGRHTISVPLVGAFNVSNMLAALTTLCLMGVSFESAVKSMMQLSPVPGRMQIVGDDQHPLVIVDYAHTPDALKNALLALKAHCQGKLYCLFGCGGDRDRSKRPLMAEAVEQYADFVMVTDDNPRTEDPRAIVQDIMQGFSDHQKVIIEHNRSKAIRDIIHYAKVGDCVLIAGKGAETYQQIGQEKIPFSDIEQVKESLQC